MLTVKEVALRWRVSTGCVYKLVADGKLHCHRIGQAIRFTEEHLRAFLERSRPQSIPPSKSGVIHE